MIIAGFAEQHAGIDLNYSIWFVSAIVPSLVSLTVIPLMIYRFFPPEVKETPNAVTFAHEELEKLGPLKRARKDTARRVCRGRRSLDHGAACTASTRPSSLCSASRRLLVTGVLAWRDLMDETHAWEVFIWYGGLVMMATALGETTIPKLFAESVASVTDRLELAARAGRSRACFLLRALRVCVDNRARDGDVHSVPCRHGRGRRTCRSDGSAAHLFREPERRAHALRHDAGTGLLRPRLRHAETLVDGRPDRVDPEYPDLVDGRARLVEGAGLVVSEMKSDEDK